MGLVAVELLLNPYTFAVREKPDWPARDTTRREGVVCPAVRTCVPGIGRGRLAFLEDGWRIVGRRRLTCAGRVRNIAAVV